MNFGNYFKCQKWIFAAGIDTNDALCVPLSFAWSLFKIRMQGHWPVVSQRHSLPCRITKAPEIEQIILRVGCLFGIVCASQNYKGRFQTQFAYIVSDLRTLFHLEISHWVGEFSMNTVKLFN